jgi:type IV secretory pathway VirB3-like protein
MKEPILKSVSRPMTLLYAPFVPAIANILGQFFIMMMIFIITQRGEAVFIIISISIVHLILIAVGRKDPHLSNMVIAYFNTPSKTKNIIKEKGNKFIP